MCHFFRDSQENQNIFPILCFGLRFTGNHECTNFIKNFHETAEVSTRLVLTEPRRTILCATSSEIPKKTRIFSQFYVLACDSQEITCAQTSSKISMKLQKLAPDWCWRNLDEHFYVPLLQRFPRKPECFSNFMFGIEFQFQLNLWRSGT